MDTNPFAMSPNAAQPQTPSYLQPQGPTTSMPGNISNMVKAIMAGNAQHQMQQQRQGAAMGAPNPMTTTGGPSVGAPMSLAPPAGGMGPPPPPVGGVPSPPVDPSTMTGGVGGPLPSAGGAGPMMDGAGPMGPMPGMPNGVDPTMAALFSPIPGQGNQYGG